MQRDHTCRRGGEGRGGTTAYGHAGRGLRSHDSEDAVQASEQDRAAGTADDDARALVRERVTQLRRSGALATGTGPENDEARAFVRARLAQLRQAPPPPRVAPGPQRATTPRPVATGRPVADAPSPVHRPARPAPPRATAADLDSGDDLRSALAPLDDTGPVGLPPAGPRPDAAPAAGRRPVGVRDAASAGPIGAPVPARTREGEPATAAVDGGPAAPQAGADPTAPRAPVPMPGVTAGALRARRAARSASPAAALVAPDLPSQPAPAAPAPHPAGEPGAAREGHAEPEGQGARESQGAPEGQGARARSVEPPPVPGIDERADALFDDTVVLPRRREVHQGRRTAVTWAAAVAAIAVLGGSGIGVTAMNAGGLDLLGARPVPTPSLAAAPPVTASPSTSPSPSPSPTETVAAAPAPAPAEQAPPPPPPPTTHTVGSADTLQSIALQFGLDPDDGWRRLFDANPQIERPELLPVGLVLRIPDAAEVLTPRALPTQEPTPEPTEEATAEEEDEEDEETAEEAEAPADDAPAVPSGSVWDQLAQCESGGNWSINTGNGYYGGLQFSASSWRAVGGTGLPHQHSREEQIRRGELLQDAQGWGAWPTCARKLGLL